MLAISGGSLLYFCLHLSVSAKAFGKYDHRRLLPRHMDRNGWEQCLPGGDVSLARARDKMLGASWLVRRLYDNLAITGGLLIDVEVSQEETSRS